MKIFQGLFIYLFWLGFHCCMQNFSSFAEHSLLLVAIAWSSRCGRFSCWGARALVCTGFCSCGAWALLLCGTWDLPRPGIKPVSLAWQDRFLTTGPPGTPHNFFFFLRFAGCQRLSSLTFIIIYEISTITSIALERNGGLQRNVSNLNHLHQVVEQPKISLILF